MTFCGTVSLHTFAIASDAMFWDVLPLLLLGSVLVLFGQWLLIKALTYDQED